VTLLLGLAAVWVVSGIITGFVMGRLGHDARLWLGLGLVAGPTSVALVARALSEHDLVRPKRVKGGVSGKGPIDVLVGVDGSPESQAALVEATGMIADRLGRLVVARVADYDSGFPGGDDEGREQARADLDQAQQTAAGLGLDPELVVLFGEPASTLESYAKDNGFELIAIGRRGRGLATTTFGSVATHLARTAEVPVLISSE
jgi:nucleotide-binding universal stress UspA family protein